MATRRMKRWKVVLIVALILLLWTFIVCFPNPLIFIRNITRYLRIPVDSSVIESIETEVPDEPEEIEKFVLALVEYQYDWENYGVPDYVATARETVIKRSGDCEDRAIVLASLLEAKNIPYDLRASLVHYWVDYPGKKANRGENEEVAFFGEKDGKYRFKMPDMSQWRRYFDVAKRGLWDVMPVSRKTAMISGWALIILSGCFLSRKREKKLDIAERQV